MNNCWTYECRKRLFEKTEWSNIDFFCWYYVKLELLGSLFFLTYINGLADKLVFKPNLFANDTSFFLFLETWKNFWLYLINKLLKISKGKLIGRLHLVLFQESRLHNSFSAEIHININIKIALYIFQPTFWHVDMFPKTP